MKNSPDISQIGTLASRFFHRYHVILYTLTVVVGVAVAIFLLYSLLASSNPKEDTIQQQTTRFDQKTIDQINSFRTRDTANANFSLPAGRTNLFAE